MIIKKFHGGSMADTYLVQQENNLYVKKEVTGHGKLNVDKLKKQFEWITNLEDEIKCKFPKIYNHDFNDCYGQYTMEFLDSYSFRDSLLFKNKLSNDDKIILNEILNICKSISSQRFEYENGEQYILNKHFNKMIERCNMIDDGYFLSILNMDTLIINGKEMKNLNEIIKDLHNFLNVLSPTSLNRSHGDYTFQNIMIDNNNDIKIIDPRGEGNDPIYYDISKLYQSCHGKYDLMISNNYKCTFNDNSINYEFYKGNEIFDEIYKYFSENIGNIFDLEKNWHVITKFYEGSHFISMVPFRYKESLENTILAYAIGIEILNNVVEELKGE